MEEHELTGWVEAYRDHLIQRNLTASTQRYTLRGVRLFVEFLGRRGRRAPAQIRTQDVLDFQRWALRRLARDPRARGVPRGVSSLVGWMESVRRFCRWLVDQDALLMDPSPVVEPLRVNRPPPRALTHEEIGRLLDFENDRAVTPHRDGAMIEILYSSGLRVHELVSLDLGDVDLKETTLLVRHGKGRKSRSVPVGDEALRVLIAYLEDERPHLLNRSSPEPEAVFLTLSGRRSPTYQVERVVARHAKEAGILGRVTPHTLRHTAAVHLLKGGATLRHIQVFLGHADLSTTAHYTQLTIEDLKDAHRRYHPRQELKI